MGRNRKKRNTKKVEETKVVKEESLKDKGNKAFSQQKYAQALEFFSQAIEADEKNHTLYSNRSATYDAMKDFTKALSDADKVIELKPDWPKGYFRRGSALENLLRYSEAAGTFEKGLKVVPEDPSLTKALRELQALMAELKMGEAEMKGDSNPDTDKFARMVKWMKDGGAKFPKLYLQYYTEDYRGVHCITKVPADDIILYVPFKYIMTSEVAKSSDIGKQIISSGVSLRSKHSYLAAYLLQETHKKTTFWGAYLKILPIFYANMPVFFDETLLAKLTGSFSLYKISDRIDSLRKEYDNIRRAVNGFSGYTHEEFVWARLVVITRIFGLVVEGTKTDGLVPYADMLNHKNPKEKETKWTFDDSRYGFIITSLRTIQRGEQVYDSYGRKCNSRFFVNYGFALEENEDNETVVHLELPKSDPHYNMKIRFLGGRDYNAKREYQIPASYREKKGKEFFSFARFVNARDSDLMVLSSGSDGFKIDDVDPISVRNEIASLAMLKAACQTSYSLFEHDLKHDIEELATDSLPMYSNERNCVLMRCGEKKVLTFYINLADECTKYLKMPWKDLKKKAAKCYQGNTQLDFYITSVVVPLVKRG